MGRLSRYRKTKACDPFNTAPNKLVHLDKAPSKNELDQDVQRAPRAFRHMMSLTKRAERRDAQKKAARQGKATGHPAQGSQVFFCVDPEQPALYSLIVYCMPYIL
eukprot:scpid88168/ scgid2075/ 